MEAVKLKDNIKWKHSGGKFRRLGPASCSEIELLAIIIGHGNKGKSAEKVAAEIVDKYGGINELMGLKLKDLMKIKGLKEVNVTKLAAVFEIARRIVKNLEKN